MVETANYAGRAETETLRWGPEILSVEPLGEPVNGEQRYQLRVRAWVGESVSSNLEMWGLGADWLRYELPKGGRWAGASGDDETVFDETARTVGTQKIRTAEFFWRLGAAEENPAVTVRSRTVPAIAHEVPINPCEALGVFRPATEFSLIPAGSFSMGNHFDADEGWDDELPVHDVYVTNFYMGKNLVTKALWDEVREWGLSHGYTDLSAGTGKEANHPVVEVSWYDVVKWCNARSEKEGLCPAYYMDAARTLVYRTGQFDVPNERIRWGGGYRLPTEAEWEKAARGGFAGRRFPWGNTISHSQANYWSTSQDSYDVSPTRGYHPHYDTEDYPYTNPVGSFAANGYGLYDVIGNAREWCHDRLLEDYYSQSPEIDPLGPASGSRYRINRGGCYHWSERLSSRDGDTPSYRDDTLGFRLALSPVP